MNKPAAVLRRGRGNAFRGVCAVLNAEKPAVHGVGKTIPDGTIKEWPPISDRARVRGAFNGH